MNNSEILNKIKDLFTLSAKEVEVVDAENVEQEVNLMEDESGMAEKEQKEAPSVSYATAEDLSAVKNELLSMIKALIEENQTKDVKEVPQELSKEEELSSQEELSEEVEEIVHSPEDVEKKSNNFNFSNRAMTPLERVNQFLNN